MADQARLNDLLDLIDQARQRGDKATEASATAAFRRESMPADVRAEHEQRLGMAETALANEQNANRPTSVLHKALTAGDLAAAGASQIIAPTLGGMAHIGADLAKNAGLDVDPKAIDEKISNGGWHTTPGYGQDIGESIAQGTADTLLPVVKPIMDANKAGLSYLSPRARANVQDLEGYAGATARAIPGIGATGKVLTRALAEAAPSAVVANTAPEIARAAGLNVSPSSTNALAGAGEKAGVIRRGLETVGGEHATHADNIVRNKPVVTDIVLQDLGLPAQTEIPNDVHGLEMTFAKAAKPFEDTYQKMRTRLGPTPVPVDDLADPISRIGRGTQSLAKVPDAVEALKAHYSQLPPMNGGQLLDTMSDLRSKGYKALASPDPDTQAVGHAQLEIAKLLEGKLTALADRVEPGLSDEFKRARTGFAKLYTADAARVGNDIDPQIIRRIGEKAGTNTGGMKLIEDMATHYEPDMQVKAPPVPVGTQITRSLMMTGGGAAGAALGTVAGGPVGALIGAAAPWATQRIARALVRATNGAADIPQIRLGRALERYYKEAPVKTPEPFNLEPSPGDFTPHQPPLQGLGDMDVPMAESTQNPRTSLDLQPPPGPRITPRQGELNLEDPSSYINPAEPGVDEIIARLRDEQARRLRGK